MPAQQRMLVWERNPQVMQPPWYLSGHMTLVFHIKLSSVAEAALWFYLQTVFETV